MLQKIKNYCSLGKPANRIEWWIIAILFLFPWILLAPVALVGVILTPFFLLSFVGFILGLVLIPFVLFTFAFTLFVGVNILYVIVSMRRYKDLGKSPLWFLIIFIPFVGLIWQVIELGFVKGKHSHA